VGRASATGTGAGLDVMLVVDNSNSMFDKGGIGSDPDLRRIEAAQMFVNYLGVDSGQGSHRAGVIFFGSKSRLVVPPTPLADQDRRAEIAALIADPQRMDWTDPASALALARDTLLADPAGGGRPAVVLLTDGKPEWDGDPTDAERQAVIQDLEHLGRDYAEEGIRLFVAQLSNQATDADPEIEAIYVPLWRDLVDATRGRFYAVRKADDLIDVYHDILVVLSEVKTEGAVVETVLEEETQVEMVQVEPELARVTFVVRVGQAARAWMSPFIAPMGRCYGQRMPTCGTRPTGRRPYGPSRTLSRATGWW
jgi:Mg-chelatase subunit ChlD